MKPLERGLWWIEYVLRHGGAKHLRAPAAYIWWAQFLELKLVVTVLSALLTIFLVVVAAVYSLYKFVLRYYILRDKVKCI